MENINNLLVMIHFLEEEGVSLDGMNCSYDKKNETLFLSHEDSNGDSITSNNITVKLNEKENDITIKQNTRIKYDFKPSLFDERLETYRVKNLQNLTKYKVHDNTLDVFRASFSQSVREDTFSGRDWCIVDIYKFNDFLDKNNMDWIDLTTDISNVKYEKKSYTIPEGYSIKDGLNGVKGISSAKVISKK